MLKPFIFYGCMSEKHFIWILLCPIFVCFSVYLRYVWFGGCRGKYKFSTLSTFLLCFKNAFWVLIKFYNSFCDFLINDWKLTGQNSIWDQLLAVPTFRLLKLIKALIIQECLIYRRIHQMLLWLWYIM